MTFIKNYIDKSSLLKLGLSIALLFLLLWSFSWFFVRSIELGYASVYRLENIINDISFFLILVGILLFPVLIYKSCKDSKSVIKRFGVVYIPIFLIAGFGQFIPNPIGPDVFDLNNENIQLSIPKSLNGQISNHIDENGDAKILIFVCKFGNFMPEDGVGCNVDANAKNLVYINKDLRIDTHKFVLPERNEEISNFIKT
jgi:hypothetical protein